MFCAPNPNCRNPAGRKKTLKWKARHKKWAKDKKLSIKDSEGTLAKKTNKTLCDMLGARELQARI